MGLDTGIELKVPKTMKQPTKFGEPLKWCSDENEVCTYEVAYWRKCWGITNAIAYILHMDYEETTEIEIEAEDIPAIIKAITTFLDKNHWKEFGDSIWEYEDIIVTNAQAIVHLARLQDYLEENKDCKVIFYVSY